MDLSVRLLNTVALVVAIAGAVDAGISREWDLLAIFVVTTGLLAAVWLRQRASRVDVTLRPDLVHWLERRAQQSGEPFDDVLDRAIASYRHGLYADDRSDDRAR